MDKVNQTLVDNLSDKELVGRILLGDKQLFGQVIDQTKGLVYQIVFQQIRLAEDRKDIIQDIYLKAFRGLKNFRFEAKLSTWIAQIAFNACRNHLEKKKPDLTIHNELWDDGKLKADSPHPEQHLLQKNQQLILERAIQNLPSLYSIMIILFHREELSYEEIARITAIPVGTVKSYLFRARKLLKETLSFQYKKETLW